MNILAITFRLFITAFLILASFGELYAAEESSVEEMRQEISTLSEQNVQLIAALQEQLALFKTQQATIEGLANRVAELESGAPVEAELSEEEVFAQELAEMEAAAAADSVQMGSSDFKPSISFGGWAGFAYTDDDQSGTKPGFDAHPLYIYAKAQPLENWSFFGELEFEHLFKSSSSGTKGDLKVERLYIEHELENGSRLRAGKFFLPFGYWYRLHWHFLTETLSRPISFNNSYVPKQQVGFEYMNTASLGETQLSYYAWLADGPDVFATNKRTESDFSFGGVVFAERTLDNGVKLGGTIGAHQQKVNFETQRSAVLGGTLSAGAFDLRGEFYHHDLELREDLQSAYLSVQYNTSDTFGFVFRHDFGDDVKTSKDASDPGTTSDSLGFIWRPYPSLLFKGEYRINEFDTLFKADYDSWNLFSAIKF